MTANEARPAAGTGEPREVVPADVQRTSHSLPAPVVQALLFEARRDVAIGKVVAFEYWCDRFAEDCAGEPHPDLIDGLLEIAEANGLVATFGRGEIESRIGEAFAAARQEQRRAA